MPFPVFLFLATLTIWLAGASSRQPESVVPVVVRPQFSSSSSSSSGSSEDDSQEAVTFLHNDEFVYEDQVAAAAAHQSQSQHHQQSTPGHPSPSVLPLQQERCPELPTPQAVAANSPVLCQAKGCRTDEDCHSGHSVNRDHPVGPDNGRRSPRDQEHDPASICCYNGCVHTCTPRVSPPVAFDWLEETELNRFSYLPDLLHHHDQPQGSRNSPAASVPGGDDAGSLHRRPLLAANLRPETVSLPGGCQVDSDQYDDLVLFRRMRHVTTCTCRHGEVLCEVFRDHMEPELGVAAGFATTAPPPAPPRNNRPNS